MDKEGIRDRTVVHIGNKTEFALSDVVRDLKGADPVEVKDVLEKDAVETRIKNICEFRLAPLADAADLAEWDKDVLLGGWPPLYSDPVGRTTDAEAARNSLLAVCRGCVSQVAVARQALDYLLGVFGPDKLVNLGQFMDASDFTWVGAMCGFEPADLGHLDRALSYAESQLNKAWLAVTQASAGVTELESHALHAGTMLLLAQEVLETVKVSLFGFSAAANLNVADIAWFPLPMWTGRGAVEKNKRTVVFIGDNFVPACLLVDRMKADGVTEKYEVCGIGQAADDLPRFYERARWVGPMVRAKKTLRTGVFDVIVASEGCMSLDVVGEARRTNSKLVWFGTVGMNGLEDRSSDATEAILDDMLKGLMGVWLRDPEKVAAVVAGLLEGLSGRPGQYVMDEDKARVEASRCRDDCDLCSYACPNAVMVSRGVKELKGGHGLKALADLEKKCCLMEECDRACPEKIPISDMMVAAFARKGAGDRFLFRGGRGGGQRSEMASYDFTASFGNSPGWFGIIGCGRADPDDVQWMANELASRNGIVVLAGCTVGDVAHFYDPEERKWFMQRYPFWLQPRSASNFGGCSACQFIPLVTLKNARSGSGVTQYGNYVETVATTFDRFTCNTIVWGGLPDRMYAIVSGLVRSGVSVVVGPISGLEWNHVMPGNKWDWQRYWVYDTLGRRKKPVEPAPKHMVMPVETKEEAVNMAACFNIKPAQGFRMGFLDGYLDTHQQYFKELPDDWHRYVRSPGDLPIAARVRLMNELVGKHGWKIEGIAAKQIPLPDGRMVDQKQYLKEYGVGGAPSTRVPRLCMRSLRERKE